MEIRKEKANLPPGFKHVECDNPYCTVYLHEREVQFKIQQYAPAASFVEGHQTLVVTFGNSRNAGTPVATNEYFMADKGTGRRSSLLQRVMHHLLIANGLKDGHEAFVFSLVSHTSLRPPEYSPYVREPDAEAETGKQWRLVAVVEKT